MVRYARDLALLALMLVLAACGKEAKGRAEELGDLADRVPPQGVHVRLFLKETERWHATYQKDESRVVVFGTWREQGKPWQMKLSSDRSENLWRMALAALAAPSKSFRYDPDIRIEMAIGDGDRAVAFKVHGPFVEGTATRALYDEMKGWVPDPAGAEQLDTR